MATHDVVVITYVHVTVDELVIGRQTGCMFFLGKMELIDEHNAFYLRITWRNDRPWLATASNAFYLCNRDRSLLHDAFYQKISQKGKQLQSRELGIIILIA